MLILILSFQGKLKFRNIKKLTQEHIVRLIVRAEIDPSALVFYYCSKKLQWTYWFKTLVYGGSDGKESACNTGDPGSIPGLRRSPAEWNGYPTPVFLPGESHGQRSLGGYSP